MQVCVLPHLDKIRLFFSLIKIFVDILNTIKDFRGTESIKLWLDAILFLSQSDKIYKLVGRTIRSSIILKLYLIYINI